MTIDQQITIDERARIMEFDGKLTRIEAERLARWRPWEKTPRWGLPPEQPSFDDDSPAGESMRFVMEL